MAAKEVSSARPIRVMIDTLLKQVYEDLVTANSICNRAFKNRIEETKKAKEKLEGALSQVKLMPKMLQNLWVWKWVKQLTTIKDNPPRTRETADVE